MNDKDWERRLAAEAAQFNRGRQPRVKTHGCWPTRKEVERRLASVEVVRLRRKPKQE